MRIAYKTDQGMVRKNNEDKFFVDKEMGIFLLADGMGGHQAGEVASEMAVNEAYAYLKDRLAQVEDERDILKLLAESLMNAHRAIKEKARSDLKLMGMGTTLIQVVVKNSTAYICHVGDSRVYLLREGLKQLTKDQTVGAYLVEHGVMPRDEIPPQHWHTLTQAVGVSDNPVPELKTVEMKEGDYLLLCTDGLTDMLTDKEIEEIILQSADVEEAVNKLIKEANHKGGRDNITMVLIRDE